MAGKGVEFLSPRGRLVQGDCFEPQTKDQQGNPLLIKNGPNKGQPTQKYFVAVAFAKNDPEWPKFREVLDSTARRDFPTLFPNPAAGCVNPNFAMKIVDGDAPDQTGRLNSTKEGFAGHWIVRFSSMYPPKCYAAGKYQPHEQLQAANGVNPIPRGHYVRVAGTVKGNDDNMKPGLYVSHTLIEWAAVGDVITNGPDAASVFGGGAAAAPAAGGLIPVPGAAHSIESLRASGWTDDQIVNGGYATRAAPPAPAAAPQPPAPPAPAAIAPPAPVTPHTAILAPTPPAPAAPAAGGLIPVPGAAHSIESLRASGWTDDQIVNGGFATRAAAPAPAPLATAGSAAPPPPAQIAAAAPPPPATGKVLLPAAGATTYQQYIDAGWTDAMLIQNGFMAA